MEKRIKESIFQLLPINARYFLTVLLSIFLVQVKRNNTLFFLKKKHRDSLCNYRFTLNKAGSSETKNSLIGHAICSLVKKKLYNNYSPQCR